MRELELFVEMTELEQYVQLNGHLPSVQLYNQCRLGSGAVGVLVAIHEYVTSPPSNFVPYLILTTQ